MKEIFWCHIPEQMYTNIHSFHTQASQWNKLQETIKETQSLDSVNPYRNDKVVQACDKIVTGLQQGCV